MWCAVKSKFFHLPMHHKHVCNIFKNTFTDATGISSLWWMLVFTIGRVDLWFHSVEYCLLYSSGILSSHTPADVWAWKCFFLKTPLLFCTIKYFISLNCIDFKNSLNESMLFNFLTVGLWKHWEYNMKLWHFWLNRFF